MKTGDHLEEPTQEAIQQHLDALADAIVDHDVAQDELDNVPPHDAAALRDAYRQVVQADQRYIEAYDWLIQYGTVRFDHENNAYELLRQEAVQT